MSEAIAIPAWQLVADEQEIRNLVARVANLNDGGDVEDYISCWTDDAVWEMPGVSHRGHAELREAIIGRRQKGISGPSSNGRHVVTNQVVRADGSDTAISESVVMFVVNTAANPTVQSVHGNRDTLRRTPAGWRIAHRVITRG